MVYLTGVGFLFSRFIFSLHVFCLLTTEGITNWRSREDGRSLLTYLKKKKKNPSSGSDMSFFFFFFLFASSLASEFERDAGVDKVAKETERYLIT